MAGTAMVVLFGALNRGWTTIEDVKLGCHTTIAGISWIYTFGTDHERSRGSIVHTR
jgi:hypothetical protein